MVPYQYPEEFVAPGSGFGRLNSELFAFLVVCSSGILLLVSAFAELKADGADMAIAAITLAIWI